MFLQKLKLFIIKAFAKLFACKDSEPKTPDFYFVLGFRDGPVNPNDYGFLSEADNPLILCDLEIAMEVALRVTDADKKDFGEDFKAKIAEVYIL